MTPRPARRLLAACIVVGLSALGALAVPTAAAAAPAGMVLACDSGLQLTRSNGASWWGVGDDGRPDGSVYVTRHLLVADLQGEPRYEKSYGAGRPGEVVVCVAQHGPFPQEGYPGSVWTVTLARTA
jgi:hypothetical protein